MNEDRQARQQVQQKQTDRTTIINAVQTPLGFFSLVVLIVEVLLGITSSFSTGSERTTLIIGMLVLIFLLVLIVAGIAIFRPMSLYGLPTKPKRASPRDKHSRGKLSETYEIITLPKILYACSPDSPLFKDIAKNDVKVIKSSFRNAELSFELDLTGDKLRSLLTKNKFDIVHLFVQITDVWNEDLTIRVGDETMPADGLVELLEVSKTKLLIIASCNSIPLAAKVGNRMNMIAAGGSLDDQKFNQWQSIFYQLLSQGFAVSRAYIVATSSVPIPMTIMTKQDVAFAERT